MRSTGHNHHVHLVMPSPLTYMECDQLWLDPAAMALPYDKRSPRPDNVISLEKAITIADKVMNKNDENIALSKKRSTSPGLSAALEMSTLDLSDHSDGLCNEINLTCNLTHQNCLNNGLKLQLDSGRSCKAHVDSRKDLNGNGSTIRRTP